MGHERRRRADRGLLLLGGLAVGAGILAVLFAGAVLADDEPSYSAFNGKQTYKTLCMNCHGVDGKGDGYLAKELRTEPTDLTMLARKNGGEYPAERVAQSIDGREEVKTHGRREMPVWGDVLVWTQTDDATRQAEVKRKVGELVEYLRTIQAPGDKKQ
jgi:mono/diheme cytochrome c family protein